MKLEEHEGDVHIFAMRVLNIHYSPSNEMINTFALS